MLRHRGTPSRTRAQSGQARLALLFTAAVCAGGYLTASAVGQSLTAQRAHVAGLSNAAPDAAAKASATAKQGPALRGAVSRPGAALPKPADIPLLHAHTVTLPKSDTVSEPSLAVDSTGVFYVTGPTGVGHPTGISASPLWKSSDNGTSFTGPISTGTGGQTVAEVGGGDSDLVIDSGNNLYLANLWLGNSAVAISTDGGTTWVQQPLGHTTPVDDRPWFAYDPVADSLYMAWDGGDALHVAKATLRSVTTGTAAAPASSLVFLQDVAAVPESILGGTPAGAVARECVCPPGGLTVDPAGNVYMAYSSQNGVGIAASKDGGLTWNISYIPDTTPTAGAAQLDYIFQPVKSDAQGNVYVVFSTTAVNQHQAVFVSYLQKGTTTWSTPMQVSVTASAALGTLAVVSPGVVDVAYFGTNGFNGDPNGTPTSVEWSVYLAQVHDLFTSPVTLTANAYPSAHAGVISTGGITGSGDRSLGDFFSIVVDNNGMAGIVTVAGSVGSPTRLVFIHQTADTLAPPPVALTVAPPPPPQPGYAQSAPAPPPAAPAASAAAQPAAPAPAPATGITQGDGANPASSGQADAAQAGSVAPPIKEPTALAHAAQSGGATLANPMVVLATLVLVTAGAGLLLHYVNRRG